MRGARRHRVKGSPYTPCGQNHLSLPPGTSCYGTGKFTGGCGRVPGSRTKEATLLCPSGNSCFPLTCRCQWKWRFINKLVYCTGDRIWLRRIWRCNCNKLCLYITYPANQNICLQVVLTRSTNSRIPAKAVSVNSCNNAPVASTSSTSLLSWISYYCWLTDRPTDWLTDW